MPVYLNICFCLTEFLQNSIFKKTWKTEGLFFNKSSYGALILTNFINVYYKYVNIYWINIIYYLLLCFLNIYKIRYGLGITLFIIINNNENEQINDNYTKLKRKTSKVNVFLTFYTRSLILPI